MTATVAPPLGLRTDLTLDPDQRQAVERIAAFDFAPIRARLQRSTPIAPAVLDLMILEFRRFLAMYAIARRPLPMFSHAVDEVWHVTLLFSRHYARLCEEAFGEFLHHDPAIEPWSNPADRWEEFARLYTRMYGRLGTLWENARERAGIAPALTRPAPTPAAMH